MLIRSQSEIFHYSFMEARACHLLWHIYVRENGMYSPADAQASKSGGIFLAPVCGAPSCAGLPALGPGLGAQQSA